MTSLDQKKSKDKLQLIFQYKASAEDLSELIKVYAEKVQPEIKKDGYRQGKYPAEKIEESTRKDAKTLTDIIKRDINALVFAELEKDKHEIATEITYDFTSEVTADKECNCEVSFYIAPLPKAIDFKKVELTMPKLKLTEKEINENLSEVRKRNASLEEVKEDVAVENGDNVNIDFEGSIDGVPFAGGKAEGHMLEIGSGSFIDTFEQQIIGKKVDDVFDVKVTFPKEYHAPEIAGKKAVFKVKVNKIFKVKLPELNDDFAKSLKFDSLDALKEKMQEQIVESFDKAFKRGISFALISSMSDQSKVSPPKVVLEQEVKNALSRQEKDENSKDKKTESQIESEVSQSLKNGYFLRHYIKSSNIKLETEDVVAFLRERYMDQGAGSEEQIKSFFDLYKNNPTVAKNINSSVLESKSIQSLISSLKIKHKEVSIADFNKILEDLSKDKYKLIIKY